MSAPEQVLPPFARNAAIAVGVAAFGLLAFNVYGLVGRGGPSVDPVVVEAPAAAKPASAPKPKPKPAAPEGGTPLIDQMLAGTGNGEAQAHAGRIEIKRILDIPGPMKYGDYVWDEKGVPAGPLVITVDLKAQTMSVFRGGYEIGASAIIYGADNKPTPLGTFPITQKDADHVSNLYDAPMPYMMRLTNDGVAIHASEVKWGNATNGCVGIPLKFAKLLFAAAKLGDMVIITDGKMLNVAKAKRG